MFAGMTAPEFDLLYAKVAKKHPKMDRKRLLSAKKDRKRDIGAGRPTALNLKESLLLSLFYYRTYVTQDVASAMFEIGQASVSRTIDRIAPVLKQCLSIPEKIYSGTKRISSVEELMDVLPELVCLTDASEQKICRPKRKDMERSHYSGKAGTHTVKVQYTTNIHGLIVHKTPHSPGRVNDITMYQMRHPTFRYDQRKEKEKEKKCPGGGGDGDAPQQQQKSTKLRHYMDRGYQGAQSVDAGTDVILPIKKKPGGKLTDAEKEYNITHSKIRVYVENTIRRVKTYRIMGDRYRNPLKKYDLANSIVCGLVNDRALARIAAAA